MAFDKLVDSAKLEMEMTATAVAIRNKTGLSETIPWEDNTGFANAVAAITVGGGSSEDVRYVTFMNEDGTMEYGKKAVATGDDCADPIAREVFSTPTKESTPQYNYTFGGWATTPGGGIDANALKAVNEDRTVYANFIAVLRYYTITYYDSDGVTVLKTDSLVYGAMPSYTPTKDGVAFEEWSPKLTAVTGNASYVAVWSPIPTFAGSTWADIAAISEAGKAATYFNIGDTRQIVYNGVTTSVVIIGFNHDDLADGSGKAGMTLMIQDFVAPKIAWYGTTYANSRLHTTLQGTAFNYLPSDLRSVVKTVNKLCDGHNFNKNIVTVAAKLWAFSKDELGESIKTSNESSLGSSYEGFSSGVVALPQKFKLTPPIYFFHRTLYRWSNSYTDIDTWQITSTAAGIKYGTLRVSTYNSSEESKIVFGFCI